MNNSKNQLIYLGTDFMFTEEIGSRLRGIGYQVHPFSSRNELENKIQLKMPNLVIIDIERPSLGGLDTLKWLKSLNITTFSICAHKSTKILQKAREINPAKVLINSQVSNNIEKYVEQTLDDL